MTQKYVILVRCVVFHKACTAMQHLMLDAELLKEKNHHIFSANSGLIRCLVPMGGPAEVYTSFKHAFTKRATPMMSSC
jgi:hypothetical protein